MRHIATRLPIAVVTFVVGITVSSLTARVWPSSSATPHTEDERAVLQVEREYVRAHEERDLETLDRILADDFTSFRGRMTKDGKLAMIANPLFSVTSLDTDDVSVIVRGDEAWVSGRARLSGTFRGRDFTTPQYGYTRHLEKRDGRWLITSCAFSLGW
jgi:ketosteroid isomerase-like protein